MALQNVSSAVGGIVGRGVGGAMGSVGTGNSGTAAGASNASAGGAKGGSGGMGGMGAMGYVGDALDLISKLALIIGNHTGSKKKTHIPPRMQQSAMDIPRFSDGGSDGY